MTKQITRNVPTNRTIPQNEKYAAEIEKLLQSATKVFNAGGSGEFNKLNKEVLVKVFTAYVMAETYASYASDVKLGITIGRNEMMQAILSAGSLEELQEFAKREMEAKREDT